MSKQLLIRTSARQYWDLPVLAGTNDRLAALTLDESTGEDEWAVLARSDPGLAAAVLGEAALLDHRVFGQSLDLESAVRRLGRSRMKHLAFLLTPPEPSGDSDDLGAAGGREASHRLLWRHSVALASVAERLARQSDFEAHLPEEVYSAGLLMHIGAMALQMAMPDRAVELRARMHGRSRSELCSLERELFGVDRFAHALQLARAWSISHKLRDLLICARDGNANEYGCPAGTAELHCLLEAAEELVARFGLSSLEDVRTAEVADEAWNVLDATSAEGLQDAVQKDLEQARRECTPQSIDPAARIMSFEAVSRDFARKLQENERWLFLARSLNEVMQYGLRRLEDRDPVPGLMFQAVTFMGYKRICHFRVEAERKRLRVARCAARTFSERVEEGAEIPYDPDSAAFQSSRVLIRDSAGPEGLALLDLLGVSSCLVAPMSVESSENPGFMCADRGVFGLGVVPGEERGFGLIAEQAGHLLHYEEMSNNMKKLATADPLTGAATRRRLMDRLEFYQLQYERTHMPLSLVILDLDHFKRFNDTMGHQVGDRLLKELVVVLEENVRRGDLIARYGGEEFVVLLPQATLENGLKVADKLRRAVFEYGVEHAEEYRHLPVSISVGVTEMLPNDSAMAMIGRADAALYRAKHNGRNCVEAAA
jgi:diguanylate cyclase (GGDEF)-like protein